MNKENIKCYFCYKNLSVTSNSIDYRLKLITEKIPPDLNYPVTDMLIEPELKEDIYFCELDCLYNHIKN